MSILKTEDSGHKTAKLPSAKGQTALEYLLIIVVSIVVIVLLMMFMQGSSTSQTNQTTCNLNKFLCSREICGTDADCQKPGDTLEKCGNYGYCDCMGNCVGSCDAAVSPPTCGVVPCTPACSPLCGQDDGCGTPCANTGSGTGYVSMCDSTDVCGNVRANPPYNVADLSSPQTVGTENCTDAVDNDCDGLTDCNDIADCSADPACISPTTCECNSCDKCTEMLQGIGCGSGTVVLTQDLIDEADTCISGNLQDKVFDCQGHKIDGKDLGGDRGIYMASDSNIEIRNCSVTDWGSGIQISSSSEISVYDSEVCSNGRDIYVLASTNIIGSSNTCDIGFAWRDTDAPAGKPCKSTCAAAACECDSCATCTAKLADASCTTVKLTQDIAGVTGICIQMKANKTFDGGGHSIEGTGASGSYGVYASSQPGITVMRLSVNRLNYGIYLYASPDSIISGIIAANDRNPAGNIGGGAIYLTSSSDNAELSDLELNSNEAGVRAYSSKQIHLFGSEIFSNDYCIDFQHLDGFDVSDVDITSNSFGVSIYESTGGVVSNNKVCDNTYNDLWNRSSNVTGTSNTCDVGTDWHDTDAPAGKPCKSTCAAAACECDSCATCTAKLADASCMTVKLIADILNYDGDCVSIRSASNKEFDCQNHLIDGINNVNDIIESGHDNDLGIQIKSSSNITVANCRIEQFDEGINLIEVTGSEISDNVLNGNVYAGLEIGYLSNGNEIRGNTMNGNGYSGLYFFMCSNNVLTGNEFCDNVRGTDTLDHQIGSGNIGTSNTCDTGSFAHTLYFHDIDSPGTQPCKNTCP